MSTVFEVVDGGLLTTIQDLGRPGLGAIGVPRAGAVDPTALAIANALAGNEPGAAALECTIIGPELRALQPVVIALAGADLGARIAGSGRRLRSNASHHVAAGERLSMPGPAPGELGSRAYLAVAGGFDVPAVLGSRSTSLVGEFGGLDGRPLRAGDRLESVAAGGSGGKPLDGRRWPADVVPASTTEPIAVLPGPAADEGGQAALELLLATEWSVAPASDRRGLRLDGPPLALPVVADAPSHGVPTGTIEVTPSGQPLVLLPDAGPTGGYPVIAIVASADLGRLGQAGPGATIRFRRTDLAAARAAEEARRHALAHGAARLGIGTDPWDDLPGLAGA